MTEESGGIFTENCCRRAEGFDFLKPFRYVLILIRDCLSGDKLFQYNYEIENSSNFLFSLPASNTSLFCATTGNEGWSRDRNEAVEGKRPVLEGIGSQPLCRSGEGIGSDPAKLPARNSAPPC